MIPKDIIMCDWHYERSYEKQGTKKATFPSVRIFIDKGFRVLPTSLHDVKAVKMFIDQSLAVPSDRMLGHLCAIFHGLEPGEAARLPQLKSAAKKIRKASGRG
jgi:hypothetical protein